MRFNDLDKRKCFERTDGQCHLCHGRLYFDSYGRRSSDDGWEIDHSRSRARGGTSGTGNLYPAHIRCNRSKGKKTNRQARAKFGKVFAPLSRKKKEELTFAAIVSGGLVGGFIGYAFVNTPDGAVAGSVIGALTFLLTEKKLS